MKTWHKPSLGGGYGINRNVSAGNTLTTAIPAMRGVARHPGTVSGSKVGKTGNKHFQGSKISKKTHY